MLPFIAGAVVGATAVLVYNNNEKVRNTVNFSTKKMKSLAEDGFEKSKELAKDVKSTVEEKVKSIKSKDDKESQLAGSQGE